MADDDRRGRLRDEIIERCLPLAEHVARRFSARGEPFDDLVQVARIGVVNAVDRFDVERGENFLSFAVPTAMGEVRRHFRDTMWSMRVPRRAKEMSLSIGKASDELVQRLGRSPRPSELADHLGVPVEEVIDGLMARSAYYARSIDAAPEDGEGRSIRDTLGDDDARLAQIDEFVTLRPALDRLPERERHILTLRFFHAMSQSEIAAEVGISQMHVSRLLTRTLSTLRADLGTDDESDVPADARRSQPR
ncbi:SigB/SigF/SigG family RNA polymerase sigma factor [Gordonia sp. ABSL49_1]|uniref:SigB/SigF/SigG family RNA polymerase sigma factor n=1 Tax=Gordonia sp. ABSL49_1 TaxID=2920941 RepID=UPI001F0DF8AC|nr:SigB/SigF/SigG family RNA polymerase sigma factor [Gordonia sp. ABSL49_1]MCH5641226.1 SigB/SigF/SigG family RNA polymerase sigma factor [Gordonia sp. ABSL49_1]